jgi:hypothetical protein
VALISLLNLVSHLITGISSCEGLSGSIGDSSCVGDKSCYKSESPDPTVSIASNACTGKHLRAMCMMKTEETMAAQTHYSTSYRFLIAGVSSCEGLSGSVGDFSCVGENSCDKSESPDLTVSIASNACTGKHLYDIVTILDGMDLLLLTLHII